MTSWTAWGTPRFGTEETMFRIVSPIVPGGLIGLLFRFWFDPWADPEKRKPWLPPVPLEALATLLLCWLLVPLFLQPSDEVATIGAGQKTKSLGTPICPGLHETPDLTFLHEAPCSVTQVPVLLCSASCSGLYSTKQPRLPAQTPASLANPPHRSPN